MAFHFSHFFILRKLQPDYIFTCEFLFILLLITDILKDLTSTSADAIYGYHTLPIVYGEHKTKNILSVLMFLNAGLSIYMWTIAPRVI